MRFGIRRRLVLLILSCLFVTMSLTGGYRYALEKRSLLADTRASGEKTGRLLSDFAAQLIMNADYASLHSMAQNFLAMPDAQEIVIVDAGGSELVRAASPASAAGRMSLGPYSIISNQDRFGELRISVYPADLDAKLSSSAVSLLIEHAFIFVVLALMLGISVTRTVISPVRRMAAAVRDVIDHKDFTRRVRTEREDEVGDLAAGVNDLVERLERFVLETRTIASRIGQVSPRIAAASRAIRRNSETESGGISSVVASAGTLTAATKAVTESADSLSSSAEQTSSAILQMNATTQEVARHTGDLTSAVEDVTTSVMEMIATIREVAEHIETVLTAAEETSASASEIEATVREVERSAQDSSRLSRQVSVEARDIGVRSIEETAAAMGRIKDSMSGYTGLVTRLGKRSEEIGKILAVIAEVTERTNLLALNASILAAQAGEQGKGFAVVAEEIKGLADRTAGSTQEISRLITAVQRETRDAVAAMAGSLTAVDEGVSRAEEARSALHKILESSGRSAETANLIERAMAEQSRGIMQVTQSVTNVKQMMSQITAATQEQSKGTEMILNAGESMRDIARRVHTAMTEQERAGKQIAGAAENVTVRAEAIAVNARDQGAASTKIIEAIEGVQDLPRSTINHMESLAQAVTSLEEQTRLLNEELTGIQAKVPE